VNESALAMWGETKGAFDIAVIDYVLPDGSGAKLATNLMAEKPGIRVILVSGMTEDNVDVPHGVRFLGKPFSLDELRRAVEAR
jgi:DNA-binding response OmpR family regulator